ncbi:MAG: spiro-SPASM protein [Spirochaetes bacterium]|nr:spiro-SPASM protein [Spirochaetota bacterium]
MKALVLDALFIQSALNQYSEQKNSIEILFELAKKMNFDRYLLLHNGFIQQVPAGLKSIVIEEPVPYTVLETLHKEAKNCETVIILPAGHPFYDEDYIQKMIHQHEKFLADYTYGLGFPAGLLPEVVKKDVLPEMMKLVEKEETCRQDYLFYSLSKDINSFDIETLLAPKDLRLLRVRIGNNDAGEKKLTQKLYDQFNGKATYTEIAEFLHAHPEKLFTIPYLLTLELTNQRDTDSTYLPPKEDAVQILDLELIQKIIAQALQQNPHINLILGGLGEPLLHPEIFKIFESLKQIQGELVIETCGLTITDSFIQELTKLDMDNIKWVIKVDAENENTYRQIHPQGNFQQANEAVKLLKAAGYKVYTQIVRMPINEEEIEKLIRNKQIEDIIIRKYSTYCGKIPDQKVVDLSPMNRIPCFHLRREIYVNATGKVSPCNSAFDWIIGDLDQQDLKEINILLGNQYREHAKKNYQKYCKNCDDYYLFLF